MLQFQKANSSDFAATRQFYWDVIEDIHKNNTANENLGWEKGVYPSDDFIQTSLEKGELYTLAEGGVLYACVILNSECYSKKQDTLVLIQKVLVNLYAVFLLIIFIKGLMEN